MEFIGSNRIACFLDAWRNANAISMDKFIIKRQKTEVYFDCNTLSSINYFFLLSQLS